MTNGWITRNLGDVCRFIDYRGRTPEKTESGLRLITAKNVKMGFLQEHPLEFVDPSTYETWMTRGIPRVGDVLFTTEAPLANVAQLDADERVVFAQRIIVLQPEESLLDSTFLKYLLLSPCAQSRIHEKGTGATVKGIKASLLKLVKVSFPSRSEQQRIVSILDEAFAGIATAKGNAEKNLQNARALFDSYLHATLFNRGEGWLTKPISECFKVRSGDFLPAKAMVETGGFDVFGGNGIAGRHNQNNLSGENIIIGRVGAKCGNVRYVKGDIWLTDNAFSISQCFHEFDFRFLATLLEHKDLRSTANQAAQPVISYTTIKEVLLDFPASTSEQRAIADQIDTLSVETHHLESIYHRKIAALDALKKSLLHEAFTGKL